MMRAQLRSWIGTVGVVMVMVFFFACASGTGTGGADGGSGGDGSSDGSGQSAGTSAGKYCEGSEVSVSQETKKEEKCASIAVVVNLDANSDRAKMAGTIGESLAADLQNILVRATVLTNSDAKALETYLAWLQMWGGEDDGGATVRRIAAAYNSADILVIPTLSGDPNGLMALRIVAVNQRDDAVIASVGMSGTADDIGHSRSGLNKALAEKMKKARVCLSLTPVRAVIDFDKKEKRQQEFTATVKDLKNEPLNEDSVSFEVDNAEGGSVSPAEKAIANGEAKTTFTMTKKQPNKLTVTYKGKFATQTETSTILPLCGWLLLIEGEKTFALDHASPPLIIALMGEGAWITLKGTNPVSGHVALEILEDDKTIYGTGWMVEKQGLTGAAFMYARLNGEVLGECHSSGTVDGVANGDWRVYGTKEDDSLTIQGLAFGSAPGGQKGSASCQTVIGSNAGGGSSAAGVFSEFSSVTMPLKAGATTEVSGTGSFFGEKYTYTLTLKRAAP